MKQKLLIIVVGIVVLIAGSYVLFFSSSKETEMPSAIDYNNVTITMERTTCFGTCPVYSLEIFTDGKVIYEGRRFVKVTGTQTAQISPLDVEDLVQEFYNIDYFSLKNEYTGNVTDLPTTTTSITIDGKTKSVLNYYGAPETLRELENTIDTVANSKQWVGTCSFDGCE